MALHKRGKVYWCYFTQNGKRIQQSTGESSRRAAESFEKRLRTAYAEEPKHAEPSGAKRTEEKQQRRLSEARDADLDRAVAAGGTASYVNKGLGAYWRNLVRILGDVRLDKIDTDAVTAYVEKRLAENVRRQTIRRELTALKRAVDGNPIKWPKLRADPKDEKLAGKARDPEILRRLLEELSPDCQAQVQFALATGLRSEELKRVRLSWVKGDLLHMPAPATKSRRARTVALTPETLAVLRRAAAKHGDAPWAKRAFHKSLKTASERIGVYPHVSLRDLRHTFATEALKGSGDLAAVMAVMGHSNLSTASLYQHSSEARARTVAAVAATISSTVPAKTRRGKR